MNDEMVNVRISATQQVHYSQHTRMRRSAWEQLKQTSERDLCDNLTGPLPELLDLKDVLSADNFEDIEMVVVDGEGTPAKPAERYAGGGDAAGGV